MPWNHNIHYHKLILSQIPPGCRHALDVGCGYGLLTHKLAAHCDHVVGMDKDETALQGAIINYGSHDKIEFINGDIITYNFAGQKFDFITIVATLHHLPLGAAIARFKELLSPNGKIVVIGLYRPVTLSDMLFAGLALPVSKMFKLFNTPETTQAPVKNPDESLADISEVINRLLPGAVLKRRFFFRCSLTWINSAAQK